MYLIQHTEDQEEVKSWIAWAKQRPEKAYVGLLAKNDMETVFWDKHGMIHIDHLQK